MAHFQNGIPDMNKLVTVHSWAVHHAARSQVSTYWGWNPASCRKATLNRPDSLQFAGSPVNCNINCHVLKKVLPILGNLCYNLFTIFYRIGDKIWQKK